MYRLKTVIASASIAGLSFGLIGCGGERDQSAEPEVLRERVAAVSGAVAARQAELDDFMTVLPVPCAEMVKVYLEPSTSVGVGILATMGVCQDPYTVIKGRELFARLQEEFIEYVDLNRQLDIAKAESFGATHQG